MFVKQIPLPVKFISGFIYSQETSYQEVKTILEKRFGKIDFESQPIDFAYTDYYEPEMGKSLTRRFISFEKLQKCERFVDIKLFCLKLEKNRVYEVASVRETIHSCAVFEEGVRTVEIFEPTYTVTTGAKLAIEGATMTFTPRECDLMDCSHFNNHCCPNYLKEGEKLRIIRVYNSQVKCEQGYKLKLVETDRTNSNNG